MLNFFKKKNNQNNQNHEPLVFNFGAPEPAHTRLLDNLDVFYNDFKNYYELPIDLKGLATSRHANAHHGSAIAFKRNQLASRFSPNSLLNLENFRKLALDFLVFGNAYLQKIYNKIGGVHHLNHVPAINVRKMRSNDDKTQYLFLINDIHNENIQFKPNEILHIMEYDTIQSFYGLPEWLCGLQSVLLNEEATLFRRRYYANGCHIGYILYTTDASIDKKIEDSLREKVQSGKGVGNFKSIYINSPNGKEKGVQVIPVGDISQKDEFERVKNISSDDVIVAHRIPPILAGLKPTNAGGFGDIKKITETYIDNEVRSMILPFLECNEKLGMTAFKFDFNVD